MAAGSASFHEAEDKLTPMTRDMHRAIVSLMEELEAIDWYQQRIDAAGDGELKDILRHNRDEEKEHAAMVLEWIRRRDAGFDEVLRSFLFTERPITALEPDAPTGNGRRGGGSKEPSVTVGSLRGAPPPGGETGPLRVRMGLHAGEAAERDNDYFGPTLNRTARIMAAGTAVRCCCPRQPPRSSPTSSRRTQLSRTWASTSSKAWAGPSASSSSPTPASRPNSRRSSRPRAAAAGFPSSRPRSSVAKPSLPGSANSLADDRSGSSRSPARAASARRASRSAPRPTQLDRFEDGVFFVDLAAARDSEAVIGRDRQRPRPRRFGRTSRSSTQVARPPRRRARAPDPRQLRAGDRSGADRRAAPAGLCPG